MPMHQLAYLFKIRQIELFERQVKLRLPFRFGVVTLKQCPQAFVRVLVESADGRTYWGHTAEMMAPKWFDKNLELSNDDNFDQLRRVLWLSAQAYLSDAKPASAFSHHARHYDSHLKSCLAQGLNPLLAAFGPAQIDKALTDAVCRATEKNFYKLVNCNALGIEPGQACLAQDLKGFDFASFLQNRIPAKQIAVRHTVGMVDAITDEDLNVSVADGLPETLKEVITRYGVNHFKIKVSGDYAEDAERLRSIAKVIQPEIRSCFISLDGNEQFNDISHFANWVEELISDSSLSALVKAISFVEQPVHRDTALEKDIGTLNLPWPLIIDESDCELDTFVLARNKGYQGVSSKACKGLYKSIINAARCQKWNTSSTDGQRFFMTGEDLTTQAGLGVQQDLALVNFLGLTHVERNGHHYVNGMSALPVSEQINFLQHHPDLYEKSNGAVRLRIRKGIISLASLECPTYANACVPNFEEMTEMPNPYFIQNTEISQRHRPYSSSQTSYN